MTHDFLLRQAYIESESDDTGSSISTIIDRFSRASTASSNISDFAVPHKSPTIDIDDVLEPFEQLERELDQKQALQKFVNETAAMLEESKHTNGLPVNPPSNLDDYDDIESLSMTMSGIENESKPVLEKEVGAKQLGNESTVSPERDCEAKSVKKILPPNTKKECNVSKTKDTRSEHSGEKKNNSVGERMHPKPIFRAKSPCLPSKPRHGILKKPKDGQQKGNANSSLQRKIANKSATNTNLRSQSLSQNSRSTSNLSQITSMIPKLDPVKCTPMTPLPRKSRSTSNLMTAVDMDSRPSLIPRPVNKTVTFAVNLVKQIQSPSDLTDGYEDDKCPEHPVASLDLPKCEPVVSELDDAVKVKDSDEKGGLIEDKAPKVEDEASRTNDPQVDDKTGEISLHTSISCVCRHPFLQAVP